MNRNEWRRSLFVLLLIMVAIGVALTMREPSPPAPISAQEPDWLVSPQSPGSNLPPEGNSLFDFLIAHEAGGKVPFPFSALMKIIEQHSPRPKAVLIPIGRSLQRMASAPDFFAFPRIVVAADSEGDALPLKDRLFLGYNEKAAIIEVISYNEAAGRFEFQVVKDYREGATPRVFYANRAVCVSCHQNAGPIFSRPLWDETNANAGIAARLQDTRRNFFGISPHEQVDGPNEIDDATDRANLFALYQLLWREGCENETCRGDLLFDLVQYRLSGKLNSEKWEQKWAARWPWGVAISNPDIPNRDPLLPSSAPLHELPADIEALNPREPLKIWFAQGGAARALAGLSEFIPASDIAHLDQSLFSQPTSVARHESACDFLRGENQVLDFQCTGAFIARGRLYLDRNEVRRGRIDRLAVGAAELRDAQGESAGPDGLKLRRKNLNARFPDGNAIEHLHFAWRNESSSRFSGVARLTVRDDFASVRSGVAQLVEQKHDALSARPFRATSAVRAITPSFTLRVEGCCEAQLPRPELEPIQGGFTAAADATRGFQRWCANCHRSNDRFPPNFLAGNESEIQAKLKHCAERIYVRLAMHEVVEKDRAKTPMPPATARERLGAAEINALRDYAAGLIKAQRGTLPALNELMFPGYEGLRACLPS